MEKRGKELTTECDKLRRAKDELLQILCKKTNIVWACKDRYSHPRKQRIESGWTEPVEGDCVTIEISKHGDREFTRIYMYILIASKLWL